MAKETPPPTEAKAKANPAEAKPETKGKADAKVDAKAKAEGKAEGATAANKRGRGVLLALVATLVLAAGGAAAYWQFGSDEAPAAQAEAAKGGAAPAPKGEPGKPPQFIALETLTVNLRPDASGEHFLQLGLTYQVANPSIAEAMKQHMPVIRSNILLLLTSKAAAELATLEGKNRLSDELLVAARQPLPGDDAVKGVAAVHYSAFIIQ